ncbi:hypothetical protein L9F63_019490, partial [Diploptera punctata]
MKRNVTTAHSVILQSSPTVPISYYTTPAVATNHMIYRTSATTLIVPSFTPTHAENTDLSPPVAVANLFSSTN